MAVAADVAVAAARRRIRRRATPRSANDPFAKMQPISRPPYNAITKPENPARFDGRQIVDMVYKANGQGQFIPGPRTAPRRDTTRVAQIDLQRAGEAERKAITNTKYSHRSPVVSPDGKWIAFLADARLRSDSVVNAERDSIAKLPPDRKRDELPRNDTEIFILPVAACEAHSAACTPRKIEYAGNETQVDVVAGQQAARVRRPDRPLQEPASVRRRRGGREAAGSPRRVAVRAGTDRMAQERPDLDGDVDGRQPRRLQHRSGDARRSRRCSAAAGS